MNVAHYHWNGPNKKIQDTAPIGQDCELVWHEVFVEDPRSDSEKEKMGAFLRDAGLPEDAVVQSLTPLNFPDVGLFDAGVFVRFPMRSAWDVEQANYLTILCTRGMLVSIRTQHSPLVERTLQLLRGGGELSEHSSQALLAFILDTCTDINTRQYMSARGMVEALADRLDDAPDSVNLDDLVPIRRAVGRLYSQFEDQFYCMGVLQTLQTSDVPFTHLRAELRDVMDSQNHVARSQEQLEMRLRDLHNDCTLHLQRKTDHRLRVLTVLTAVCMPLSVIAGIYGMNFSVMPELEWPYGYYCVLGFMAAVVAGLLLFFYKRGWFK